VARKRCDFDYIVPVTLPRDLAAHAAGRVPDDLLRPVPGGGRLHWLAAQAWMALVSKAACDGVELKPTSAGDTYRSYEAQLAAFKQRYTTAPIPGASTRTFEGRRWYLKRGAPLAAPGSSQHNWGIAVDVHSAAEKRRLRWLIANVKDFGFSWEVVPAEPWHIRYVAGDDVPAAVQAWVAAHAAPAKKEKEEAAPADDGGSLDPGDGATP
jgi:hypothetical protein